jgi:hypothetical protein
MTIKNIHGATVTVTDTGAHVMMAAASLSIKGWSTFEANDWVEPLYGASEAHMSGCRLVRNLFRDQDYVKDGVYYEDVRGGGGDK